MRYFNLEMSSDEAKSKYYELAKVLHPDGAKDDGENKTKLELYKTLKAEYDEFSAIKKHWNEIVEFIKSKNTQIQQKNKIDYISVGKSILNILETISINQDSQKTK
jgi:DnaJ-class molecular chaperone